MIFYNNDGQDRELTARYFVELVDGEKVVRTVTNVYRTFKEKGEVVAKLVWELISSCFGAGFWQNDYPWKNEDPWKN